jgi:hypothetical protein
MALYVLGDPHLSALQPWRLPLGDAFLSWFEGFAPGPMKQNSLLVLGDYTDDAVNPGKVVKQLTRFVDIARDNFSHIYFMVGNHDLKLYRNKPQLSFEFVERFGVHILRDPGQILDIEGMHILSLPHYNYRNDLPSMSEYYSQLPKEIQTQHFDITFGHFTDVSVSLFDHMVDLSYLSTQYICLGHQHLRYSPHYIGSVYPCKISENTSPKPRAIWVFEKINDKVCKREIPLPLFGEYRSIDYPKPLPSTKANVTIWTISGCESEKLAREYYGEDIYIRSVDAVAKKITNTTINSSDDTFIIGEPLDIFNEWAKIGRTTAVSRPVATLIRKLLKASPTTTLQTQSLQGTKNSPLIESEKDTSSI